jgi:membrane protein implicated in regulation of membrane protease activity
MTVFLSLGVIGLLLLVVFIFVDDHLGGILDALGGGDWFTGASLAGFLGALGFGGAVVYRTTGSLQLGIVAGAILGLALGVLVGWIMLRMRKTQDGGAPVSADLVGLQGTVVSDIPIDGYGEVKVTQSGHLVKLNARAETPVPVGAPVQITEVLSATAVRIVPLFR